MFIHSFHFYSASSSPLLLRSIPDTAWLLCRSFKRSATGNCKNFTDLPKVPTWWLERDSNPRSFGRKAHSFIHSDHFYSASSSPLLFRGAPNYSTDTASEFHAEAHSQLQVKDLPKVPTWRLERESNPRPSG